MTLKKNFHWEYLKETCPEFRKFKLQDEYERKTDLKDPSEYWSYLHVSFKLMIPYFKVENYDKLNGVTLKQVKMIRWCLIGFYFTLISLILLYLYTAKII
jgi:hypothetical protein